MQTTYFTPGPTQTHAKLTEFMTDALSARIPSVSHRSADFQNIFASTTSSVRKALGLPDSHSVFFVSSATEAWERFTQSVVAKRSFHLVNGAFSKGWHESAIELGKQATALEAPEGHGFSGNISVPPDTEMIAVTNCETSTGAWTKPDFIHSLRASSGDALVAVDLVSSAPIVSLDFSKVDCAFFSVQKCCGLPAGLGVMAVSARALQRASELRSKSLTIGSYNDLNSLAEFAAKSQTPCTPNVLGIYLLGRVLEDYLSTGIDAIRSRLESRAKAALANISKLKHFSVLNPPQYLAPTVLVLNSAKPASLVKSTLLAQGFAIGDGYGHRKEKMIRIANFPTTTDNQFLAVIDAITRFDSH